MSGDITLTLGMSQNLYSLQQIDKLMQETNNRLATGKRVGSALDDPINYFDAQEHSYRSSDLQMRKDTMNEAVQLITAADAGIESILDMVDSAIALANSALTATDQAEVNDLENQLNEIFTQIDSLASDAYYGGVNLLGGATETLEVFFDEDGSSSITLTGEDASSTGLGLAALTTDDWWDGTNGVPDDAAVNTTIDALTSAKNSLRTMSKTLSVDLSIVNTRLDFTERMMNTLDDGAAKLTNADMNEESANLLTLQTQQSLATNSLSISSQSAQSVLQLFS